MYLPDKMLMCRQHSSYYSYIPKHWAQVRLAPIMLLKLPVIPSRISQKFKPIIILNLFPYHPFIAIVL